MATITYKVDGLKELGEAMRALSSKVSTSISGRAVGAAARMVREKAKRNIQTSPSIDTGALLKAVIVKKIPKSKTPLTAEYIVTVRGRGKKNKKTGEVSASAPHGNLVEFGTVRMPAEPYLRPALEKNYREATEIIKKRLAAGIEKAKTK